MTYFCTDNFRFYVLLIILYNDGISCPCGWMDGWMDGKLYSFVVLDNGQFATKMYARVCRNWFIHSISASAHIMISRFVFRHRRHRRHRRHCRQDPHKLLLISRTFLLTFAYLFTPILNHNISIPTEIRALGKKLLFSRQISWIYSIQSIFSFRFFSITLLLFFEVVVY